MNKYREYLIDSDYCPMTEFCKPEEDDIHVIEKEAYSDLLKEAEAMAEALETYKTQGDFMTYDAPSTDFVISDYGKEAKKALARFEAWKKENK